MSSIQSISFKIFGGLTEKKQNSKLKKKLRQAHIGIPSDKYRAVAMFISLIAGLIGGLAGYMLVGFLSGVELPFTLLYVTEGSFQEWLWLNRVLLLTIGIVPVFILIFSQVIYRLFLLYPSFSANLREGQIDVTMSNAVTFMYALSRGGTNIMDIFRSLHTHSDIYGEVGKEAGMIVRDMEYFGHDLTTAIHNTSGVTPSSKLKNFLEGLVSSIDSGGNISSYLQARSNQFREEAVLEQKQFLETIAIIAETYVTAFVAGPLFLITIIVIMGMMTAGQVKLLQLIIYAVIPIGSAVFIIMLSMISGRSPEARKFYKVSRKLDVFKDVQLKEPDLSEAGLFRAFDKYQKRVGLITFLKNPLRSFFEKPWHSLIISIPAGLIYFGVRFLDTSIEYPVAIDVAIAALIAMIPFSIFYELRERKIRKIENAVPDFLSGLAGIQEAGLTLSKAIRLMLSSNLGVLSSEVKKIWGDIRWGSTTTTAFMRFEQRIKTGFISRTVNLITKASEVSGDIREVLTIAARDAVTSKNLRQERRATMFMYVIVVYISFAVFLFIILVLTVMFLGNVPTPDVSAASSGVSFIASDFDVETYKEIFFHAALVQGFCSGLIAGQMGEGYVLNGVKHSIIMLLIALLTFIIFIF